MFWVSLPQRGVIAVSGADRKSFLQGLITQDIFKLAPEQVLFSAFLTPQGRYLCDFFILEQDDTIYLEIDRESLEGLLKRLNGYKLRLDVHLEDVSSRFRSFAIIREAAYGPPLSLFPPFRFIDPRLSPLGGRLLLDASQDMAFPFPEGTLQDYDLHRLKLGIPDGRRDLIPEKAILLENGFAEMDAISWDKGCYLGQELTARTHYRGLVRKRLLPLHLVSGPLPPFGTPLVTLTGEEAGEMRSGQEPFGLALIRLEAFFAAQETGEGVFQTVDGKTQVKPYTLPWMRITWPPS